MPGDDELALSFLSASACELFGAALAQARSFRNDALLRQMPSSNAAAAEVPAAVVANVGVEESPLLHGEADDDKTEADEASAAESAIASFHSNKETIFDSAHDRADGALGCDAADVPSNFLMIGGYSGGGASVAGVVDSATAMAAADAGAAILRNHSGSSAMRQSALGSAYGPPPRGQSSAMLGLIGRSGGGRTTDDGRGDAGSRYFDDDLGDLDDLDEGGSQGDEAAEEELENEHDDASGENNGGSGSFGGSGGGGGRNSRGGGGAFSGGGSGSRWAEAEDLASLLPEDAAVGGARPQQQQPPLPPLPQQQQQQQQLQQQQRRRPLPQAHLQSFGNSLMNRLPPYLGLPSSQALSRARAAVGSIRGLDDGSSDGSSWDEGDAASGGGDSGGNGGGSRSAPRRGEAALSSLVDFSERFSQQQQYRAMMLLQHVGSGDCGSRSGSGYGGSNSSDGGGNFGGNGNVGSSSAIEGIGRVTGDGVTDAAAVAAAAEDIESSLSGLAVEPPETIAVLDAIAATCAAAAETELASATFLRAPASVVTSEHVARVLLSNDESLLHGLRAGFIAADTQGDEALLARFGTAIGELLGLNDIALMDALVGDELFGFVVGCFEFTPFGRGKRYRHVLREWVRYHDLPALEMPEDVRQRVHKAFRLTFLRDTVLSKHVNEATLLQLQRLTIPCLRAVVNFALDEAWVPRLLAAIKAEGNSSDFNAAWQAKLLHRLTPQALALAAAGAAAAAAAPAAASAPPLLADATTCEACGVVWSPSAAAVEAEAAAATTVADAAVSAALAAAESAAVTDDTSAGGSPGSSRAPPSPVSSVVAAAPPLSQQPDSFIGPRERALMALFELLALARQTGDRDRVALALCTPSPPGGGMRGAGGAGGGGIAAAQLLPLLSDRLASAREVGMALELLNTICLIDASGVRALMLSARKGTLGVAPGMPGAPAVAPAHTLVARVMSGSSTLLTPQPPLLQPPPSLATASTHVSPLLPTTSSDAGAEISASAASAVAAELPSTSSSPSVGAPATLPPPLPAPRLPPAPVVLADDGHSIRLFEKLHALGAEFVAPNALGSTCFAACGSASVGAPGTYDPAFNERYRDAGEHGTLIQRVDRSSSLLHVLVWRTVDDPEPSVQAEAANALRALLYTVDGLPTSEREAFLTLFYEAAIGWLTLPFSLPTLPHLPVGDPDAAMAALAVAMRSAAAAPGARANELTGVHVLSAPLRRCMLAALQPAPQPLPPVSVLAPASPPPPVSPHGASSTLPPSGDAAAVAASPVCVGTGSSPPASAGEDDGMVSSQQPTVPVPQQPPAPAVFTPALPPGLERLSGGSSVIGAESAASKASKLAILDLIGGFIERHGFRAKFWVLSTVILPRIMRLTRYTEPHMVLAALRLLKAVIQQKDDFLLKALVTKHVFADVIAAYVRAYHSDNLVKSAVLDILATLATSGKRALVDHVANVYAPLLQLDAFVTPTLASLCEAARMNWRAQRDALLYPPAATSPLLPDKLADVSATAPAAAAGAAPGGGGLSGAMKRAWGNADSSSPYSSAPVANAESTAPTAASPGLPPPQQPPNSAPDVFEFVDDLLSPLIPMTRMRTSSAGAAGNGSDGGEGDGTGDVDASAVVLPGGASGDKEPAVVHGAGAHSGTDDDDADDEKFLDRQGFIRAKRRRLDSSGDDSETSAGGRLGDGELESGSAFGPFQGDDEAVPEPPPRPLLAMGARPKLQILFRK